VEGSNSVGYPSLAKVRKTLRVKWYRSPIEFARLRELSNRSDLQGWVQAGGHLLLWAVTGTVVYLFWSQQMWLGFTLALFVHGTIASFFTGIGPHELGHGTVFRTKRLNKVFLYVYSLLSWWDPFDYASSHTYHHRYTLYPEGDRENLLPLNPSLRWSLLLQLFTINLFTPAGRTFGKGGLVSAVVLTVKGAMGRVGRTDIPSNEWLQALHADQPDEHRKAIRWSRTLLIFHGSVLVASIATGLWVLPLIISFSSFIASWAAYFVGLTQHCGLRTGVPDFRKSTRSITLNPLVEFLYWRMNWHLEHHMYAAVPCYNLKKLSRELAGDMPEPRTLLGAWREMRETWRRQQTDPTYEFDTPLPAEARGEPTQAPGELESSIGELAPKGLE
jgi:fatty acid desaturase